MQQSADEQFQNYLSQLHNTLEVLSASAQEQCDLTGSYNAPWELRQDGTDFITAVVSLDSGSLQEFATRKLLELRDVLATLPDAAITPDGQNMTTAQGCLVAFNHPCWNAVRAASASCLLVVDDPFA